MGVFYQIRKTLGLIKDITTSLSEVVMSISKMLMQDGVIRLVIPYAGKMFHSSINKTDKALCFLLNKGYLESDSLEILYYVVEDVRDDGIEWLIPVGKIEKIHTGGSVFCYRQRVFFKSIVNMCSFCKQRGISVQFSKDFTITINNVLSCLDDLKYLEVYARVFNMSIDEFLTDTCKVQLYLLLDYKRMSAPLSKDVKNILKDKIGFLERAPYLAGSYDISKHTSTVYIPTSIRDERIYRDGTLSSGSLCGFVNSVVESDRKAGVFQK